MTSLRCSPLTFIGTTLLTALLIPMCSSVLTESRLEESYFDSGEINGLGRQSDTSASTQSERHRMRRAVDESDCDAYVSDKRLFRETTYLDLPLIGSSREARIKTLTEIHIRHNLKGNVELRDSPDGFFRVQIRRSSGLEDEVSRITQQYRLEDTPGGKMIYVQVDYDENATSLLTIIGGVAAVLILFSLIILVIWIYHKRHMEEAPPTSSSSSRSRVHGLAAAAQDAGSPSRKPHSRTASPNLRRPGSDLGSPHQRGRGTPERSKSSESVQPLPLPPPPRANAASRMVEQKRERQGSGSSHGTYRGTMVTFTVLSLVTLTYGALCQMEPRADVIVTIPANFDFGSVNVFFAKRNKGQLNMEHWSQKDDQYKKVFVFDMDSARPSNNSVCSPKDLCPTADHQGLAGCDIAGQACVCSRGYRLRNGACHDIDECAEDPEACPAGITCTDQQGSHLCNCPLGYFYNLGDCQRCSAACPEGQFEVKQCSAQHDRICKPCSRCDTAMYSIRPCGGVWDNQCIHAAHPVLMAQEESFPFMIQGLHSNWSDNVVVEDLHNTRDLEATFYATAANEQQYDFWWVRESKIKVNIGVERVNIFPKFTDVDHANSDNQFMEGTSSGVAHVDSDWFRKITRNYCRYPVPEFYKIILEIGRDRMTNATERRCRANDLRCLEKVTDFARRSYVERSLNDQCRSRGTFPVEMREARNTVVCVDGAEDMLRDLFGLAGRPVTPIRHAPGSCAGAHAKCDSCLDVKCGVTGDPFTRACCQKECYGNSVCGPSFSYACQNSKIECAQGDAYSFTLEPRFHTTDQNHTSSFQCHLRHQKPELLYKLWFYVSIPDKFDLPKISRDVYMTDVQDMSRGTYKVEFIDLEHDTLVDLDEEVMLVGTLNEKSDADQFTLYPLKKAEDYQRTDFEVGAIIDKQSYETAVQFNDIFGLSTTSWRTGHCRKDTSKFYSVQTHYRNNPQKVSVIKETARTPYKYYIKHANEKDPFLRFSTPANTSVLKWYFESQPSTLIVDETLQLDLHLLNDARLWNISLKGVMTECPGYLAVTINDRIEDAELFKYDTIIECDNKGDATFNATFKIPHFGSGLDKTFDVILDDAKKEYRMFLTHINLDNEDRSKVAQVTVTLDDTQSGIPILMICIVSVTIVLMVCVSVCLYLAVKEKTDPIHMQEDRHYYDTLIEPGRSRTSGKHKHPASNNCCTALRHMTTSRMMIVILYITFKVIYCFAFTFSVFFTVLVLFVQGHLETITQVDMVQLQHQNQSVVIQKQVEIHVQREVERQARQALDTQNACYGYLDQVTDMFANDVDNFTDMETLQDFFLNGPSISGIFRNKFQEFVNGYEEKLDQYELEYQTLFNRSLSYYFKRYAAYLDTAFYKNPWLVQWAHSFNQTTKDPQFFQDHIDESVNSPIQGSSVDFAKFARVDEVDEVELWPIQFWERYYAMPDMPVLSQEMFLESQCAPTSLKRIVSDTISHTDSIYFIYPQTEEPEQFIGAAMDTVFSVQDFLQGLNLGVLRLVFFSMDILLIFYRLTHLYLAVRSLCLGFVEHVHLNAEDIRENGRGIIHRRLDHTGKYYTEQYIPLRPTYDTPRDPDDTTQVSDQDTLSSIIPPSTTTTTTMTTTSQPHSAAHSKHKTNGDVVHSRPTNGNTTSTAVKNPKDNSKIYHRKVALSNGIHRIKTCLKVLLEGTLLPKFVLGTALLLVISMTINIAQTVLTVDNIVSLACFVPNLPGLRWHIDSANEYLNIMAKQLFSTSFNWYGDHMTSELKYMQSFQDYFNQEQERRTSNYIKEGCAVQGVLYSNGSCQIHRDPPKLDVPMMPCNFVPIQPFLYTDHNLTILEDTVGENYSPIIQSAQSILLHTIHGALVIASVMLISHAIGVLLMYYFKVRGIFPTREIYAVPASIDLGSLYGSRQEGGSILRQYAPDGTVGQYDTSFETEDMDIDDTHDSTLNTAEVPITPQPLYSTVSRFDPAQHARTVQFRDVPSFDDPDGGSKTLPVQTSSPRVVPKTISQTVKPMKLSKRTKPQALADMGYSETKV